MRTTLDINPNHLERVRKLADAEGVSFKEALSRVITRGLAAPAAHRIAPLDLPTFNVGFHKYFDVDRVKDVINAMDDERIFRSM
jgi:hypothetical protein